MTEIQQDLWHDTLEDAVRAAVDVLGGPKQVAHRLWPGKAIADGRRYLLHCLDTERNEKLSFGELERIGAWSREAGCDTIIAYLAKTWSYEQPRPVEPEDEKLQLQKDFIAMGKQMAQIADRLQRLGD